MYGQGWENPITMIGDSDHSQVVDENEDDDLQASEDLDFSVNLAVVDHVLDDWQDKDVDVFTIPKSVFCPALHFATKQHKLPPIFEEGNEDEGEIEKLDDQLHEKLEDDEDNRQEADLYRGQRPSTPSKLVFGRATEFRLCLKLGDISEEKYEDKSHPDSVFETVEEVVPVVHVNGHHIEERDDGLSAEGNVPADVGAKVEVDGWDSTSETSSISGDFDWLTPYPRVDIVAVLRKAKADKDRIHDEGTEGKLNEVSDVTE
jgi:hypothetical protein